MGAVAVRAHDAGRGANRLLRDGRGRAFYLLTKRNETYGRTFVRAGVIVGTIAAVLQLSPRATCKESWLPTISSRRLRRWKAFESQEGAPLAILGQPDVEKRKLDNPLEVPKMLSFLTYKEWRANVKGLSDFRKQNGRTKFPALLQLSRDGGSRDHLHRRDGSGFAATVARKTA